MTASSRRTNPSASLRRSCWRACREAIFAEDFLKRLVTKANQFLNQEAKRPRQDVRPIKAEIKKTKAIRDRLAHAVAMTDGTDVESLVKRVQATERRLKELRREFKNLRVQNGTPPPPLKPADVAGMLDDLRGLLNEDVAVAAPLLAQLTGPIRVMQGEKDHRKWTPWAAEFTINAVPVLLELARRRNCPTTQALEHLYHRGWTMPQDVKLTLEYRPVSERIVPMAKGLAAKGHTIDMISHISGTAWEDVQAALSSPGKASANAPGPAKSRSVPRQVYSLCR